MKKMNISVENVIHGVALEPADFDRLLLFLVHYTGAFAEDFSGTHASAAVAQNIRFEYHARRATQIVSRDFLDEGRDVNVGRARHGARRVKAEKTARGFDGGLARSHAGRNFRKILFVLFRSKFGRSFAHVIELSCPSLELEREPF